VRALHADTSSKEATKALCADYESDPAGYDTGAKTFDLNEAIYAHASIKAILLETQHHKCAFWECKFSHQQYGDVEHFRPKHGYNQKESDPLGRPGYYWLAYEWTKAG